MPNSQITNKIREWIFDPVKFTQEALHIERLTTQQRDALEEWGTLIRVKLKRSEGRSLTSHEQQYVHKIGMSIHSGHTTGKDAIAAWIILHFLVCTTYPKIICTAPTDAQLRSILWSEIHKWLRNSAVSSLITFQAEKIYFTEAGGREWFAIPRTVSTNSSEEEQAETIAGFNAPFKLIVVDEASGVSDAVFRPLEGGLGQKCNLVLMIGNPTKHNGFFYNSHYGSQRQVKTTISFEEQPGTSVQVYTHPGEWIVKRWNAEESENVNQDHVIRMRDKYGKDSNAYRIRVLGLPPTATPDALVPWDWLDAATSRDLEPAPDDPLAIGVDVARFGDDLTVIATCRGMVTEGIYQYSKLNGIEVAEWIDRHCDELREGHEAYGVGIDIIGVGASVFDHLSRYSPIQRIYPVNVAEAPADSVRFDKLRDEILWNVREEFQAGIVKIPYHQELMAEANAVKWAIMPSGKIKIESKKEMKSRGLASPNFLDAYAIMRYTQKQLTRFNGTASFRRRRAAIPWTVG